MNDVGKMIIGIGLLLVAVGAIVMLISRTGIPIGRLPGDITYRGKNTVVYFPIVTSIILSVVLSLILWLVNHWRR